MKGCMKTRFLFLTSLIFLSGFVSVCPAATNATWDGGAGTSDWNTATNWNPDTVPGSNSKAVLKFVTGPIVTTSTPTVSAVSLGGNGGVGILTVQPGAVINCTDTWAMGQSSGEGGVLAISGGAITIGSWFYVGNGGTGTVNMSGGSISVAALFSIAFATGSTGTVNLDGGTITAATFSMAPSSGTARLNITGGRLIINSDVTGTIAGYITNGWIKGYGSASNVRYDYNVTTSGKTTVWAVASFKATNPSPANGVTDVARDATLSWTAGPGAGSHDVYFGTASPGTFQVSQSGTAFNPGQLTVGTTYYWRIDEVNGPNTVTGDVWSFTTVSGQAKNPDPTNSAANVAFDKILRWTAGPGAASHDVYFGTTLSDVNNANRLLGDLNGNSIVDWDDMSRLTEYWLLDPAGSEPYAGVDDDNIVDFMDYALFAQDWMNSAGPVFKGNQDANSFNPGLALNTTYYWRVDEVNGPDTAKGAIWSFTTQSGKAYNPSPVNSVSNVATSATLSWTAGAGATSHDVYFGTTSPGTFRINQTGTTYNPGTLANSTTYYWRIDEVGSLGTVQGDAWNFTTVPLSTTPVYPYLSWRNDPTNSVVVNWWNPSATGDSSVDYGPTSSYGSTVTVPTITNVHHVELTGLTSGATYHYRVRSSDGTISSDAAFTVAVASPTSFKFAVFGDTQINYDLHRAQSDHMLTKNPLFVMHTGDMAQEGNNQTDWENLYKAEQNLSKSRVIMPTMGNHEVQPGSQPYYYFFDMYADGLAVPDNGMAAYGPRTYSFDYGNTHHIIISSYQINAATEKDWIAADLADANANPNIKWIFAYMHMPLYTAGQWAANKTALALWGPVFDQYHVDIVFAGHNHIYERSYPIKNNVIVSSGNGTIHTTCGLGANPGGPWNSGSPDAPFFEKWYTPNKTGATYITINGNSLTAELIMVDNAVLDTFTITK